MIAFLFSPLGRLVAVGLVAAAVGFYGGFTLNGWRLGEDLAQCESRAREFEQAYGILTGKVAEQNDAINSLSKRAAKARQQGRSAAAAASAMAEQQAGAIDALKARIAGMTPPGETCDQVWGLIREGKL